MWDRHSCLCLASLICLESQQGVTVLSQGPLSGSFHTWDLAFGCSVPTNQPLVSECYIPQFIPGVIRVNSLTIWGAGVWHVFSFKQQNEFFIFLFHYFCWTLRTDLCISELYQLLSDPGLLIIYSFVHSF